MSSSAAPPLLSRGLLLVFAASLGATTSFYLLLSVVPLYATAVGAGGVGAGLTTGALMGATVATELATPRLVALHGQRVVFAAGLLLLGAPALALGATRSLTAIVIVCAVRGIGFAIAVVLGSSLVAGLLPDARRGEGLGLYGLVVGLPAVIGLPLGVWLVGRVGYDAVFVAAAVAALAALATVVGLPHRPDEAGSEPPVGVVAGLRTPALARPMVVFGATAVAAGAVVTFLPLALPPRAGNVAALALLAQAAAATLGRWWAGHHGDRRGSAGLLLPSLVAAAAGVLALTLIATPTAVLLGMTLFGAAFGVAQNASLAMMLARVPRSGYDTVSALWNIAYDAGLGLGGAGFGVLAARTGYPIAFAVTGALMLAALVPGRHLLRDTSPA